MLRSSSPEGRSQSNNSSALSSCKSTQDGDAEKTALSLLSMISGTTPTTPVSRCSATAQDPCNAPAMRVGVAPLSGVLQSNDLIPVQEEIVGTLFEEGGFRDVLKVLFDILDAHPRVRYVQNMAYTRLMTPLIDCLNIPCYEIQKIFHLEQIINFTQSWRRSLQFLHD